MGPSGLSERALVALRTSKLSKNCASRGLVGPFRRAARAEKGPPGLQGGAAVPAAPPWLRACRNPRVRYFSVSEEYIGQSPPTIASLFVYY